MPVNHIVAAIRSVTRPGESSHTSVRIVKACTGGGASFYDTDSFSALNKEDTTCSECKKLSDEFLQRFRREERGRLMQCIAYSETFKKGDRERAVRILLGGWEKYDDIDTVNREAKNEQS